MEDYLYIAVSFGVLIAVALFWVAGRAISARLAFGAALDEGWEAMTEPQFRRRVHEFPPGGADTHVDRIATRPVRGVEVIVARSTGKGRDEAWLVMPGGAQLERAIIGQRAGSGSTRANVGDAIRTDLPADWAWAWVSGPANAMWFTEARAVGLKAVLQSGDELYLHDRDIVLSRPVDQHATLLRDAEELRDALMAALD